MIVRLVNASETEHVATLRSGLLRIASAVHCDALEQPSSMPDSRLELKDGNLSLTIPARRLVTLQLELRRKRGSREGLLEALSGLEKLDRKTKSAK